MMANLLEQEMGIQDITEGTCIEIKCTAVDNHMILYVVIIDIMASTVSTIGLMEYFWTSENIRSVNNCFENTINDVNGTINKSAFMMCNFAYNDTTEKITTPIIVLHVIIIIATVNASTLYQRIKFT